MNHIQAQLLVANRNRREAIIDAVAADLKGLALRDLGDYAVIRVALRTTDDGSAVGRHDVLLVPCSCCDSYAVAVLCPAGSAERHCPPGVSFAAYEACFAHAVWHRRDDEGDVDVVDYNPAGAMTRISISTASPDLAEVLAEALEVERQLHATARAIVFRGGVA